MIYDLIFVLLDANNQQLAQFSKHGKAFVGCIKYAVMVKHSDKVCVRMDYLQTNYCRNRNPNITTMIRFFDDPGEDRDKRKWFGNYIIKEPLWYNRNET